MPADFVEASLPKKAPPTLEEIKALPKVELHAHLSGSISQEELAKLVAQRGDGESFQSFDCRADLSNSMVKCFDYFAKVAKVIDSLEALKTSTAHVLQSFAADNCIYLELRTSPKQFNLKKRSSDGTTLHTTKLEYLQTVKEAIDEFQKQSEEKFGFTMEVKILLSVDRGKVTSQDSALQQIDDIILMQKSYPDLVVGVDICGNPSKPTVSPYVIPALLKRREAFQNLPITFHTAEVKDDEESRLIVDNIRELNIRRLGHVCFFPDFCREKVLGGIHDAVAIGIELCPTSNLVTRQLDSLSRHHFSDWWKQSDKVLISFNTDDCGMFSCTSSSECYDMAIGFNLSMDDLIDIQRQALMSSFHPAKEKLQSMFELMLPRNFG